MLHTARSGEQGSLLMCPDAANEPACFPITGRRQSCVGFTNSRYCSLGWRPADSAQVGVGEAIRVLEAIPESPVEA